MHLLAVDDAEKHPAGLGRNEPDPLEKPKWVRPPFQPRYRSHFPFEMHHNWPLLEGQIQKRPIPTPMDSYPWLLTITCFHPVSWNTSIKDSFYNKTLRSLYLQSVAFVCCNVILWGSGLLTPFCLFNHNIAIRHPPPSRPPPNCSPAFCFVLSCIGFCAFFVPLSGRVCANGWHQGNELSKLTKHVIRIVSYSCPHPYTLALLLSLMSPNPMFGKQRWSFPLQILISYDRITHIMPLDELSSYGCIQYFLQRPRFCPSID